LYILDQQLWILDITFSSNLALADRAFATALTRVRREISHNRDYAAQLMLSRAAGRPFKSILELATTVSSGASLSKAEDVATRWFSPVQDAVNLSRSGAGMQHIIKESLREPARLAAIADIRLRLVEHVASDVYRSLSASKTTDGKVISKEAAASSAMMSMQLNIPAWQHKFNLPQLQKVPKWSSLSIDCSFAAGEHLVEKSSERSRCRAQIFI
jgi:hypothetical protein